MRARRGYLLLGTIRDGPVSATSSIKQLLIDKMLIVYKPSDCSGIRCAMDIKTLQSDLMRPLAPIGLVISAVVAFCIGTIYARAATVEAQQTTLQEQVQSFVRTITRNTGFSDDESLIRWNTPICFLAAGWGPEDISSALARLSQIGATAGAPLAGKACTPNFVVVSTAAPDEVIKAWYAKNKQLFGNASPLQVRRFLDTSRSRPVRIWRNIDVGRVATTRFGHFVPSNSRADPSPFAINAPLGFLSVFEIIDASRTAATELQQLTDYVAMMGLSNIDIDADVGNAPSILQLFSPVKSPALGLSNWDAAYLAALYQTDHTSRSQRFEIARRVAEAVAR